MAKQPLGVTFNVPSGQDATGVYESDDGVDIFYTETPYTLSDEQSLQPPLPIFVTSGPVFEDGMGNSQSALAVSGIEPPEPIQPGPLDYADPRMGAFTDFTREFGLASETAVMGFVCDYTGNPVITITHGGEPLTILRQERFNGILALIAAGTGLTVEVAELNISASGGELNGGAFRINEVDEVGPISFGWTGGQGMAAKEVTTGAIAGAQGGVVKSAYGSRSYDPYHYSRIVNADVVWQGFLDTGPVTETDYGPDGDWVLGAGWSWDGDDLVHTGAESVATLTHPIGLGRSSSGRAYVEIDAGATCGISVYSNSFTTYAGPYEGAIYHSVTGKMSTVSLRANGNVRVTSVRVSGDTKGVSWAFGTNEAVDGVVLTGTSRANRPDCVIAAAEIVGGE